MNPAPRQWHVKSFFSSLEVHEECGDTVAVFLYNKPGDFANAALIAAAPDLLEAAIAGGRYSDALLAHQEQGIHGEMVNETAELEALFKDWHDKSHAAIAKVQKEAGR